MSTDATFVQTNVFRGRRKWGKAGVGGALLAAFVIVLVIIGPFVAPYDPDEFVTTPFAAPSAEFLLGGDQLGRDTLSQLLVGGGAIVLISAVGTAIGVCLGSVLGMYAGLRRGRRDQFLMRLLDILMSLPELILALVLVSVVGASPFLVTVAVCLAHAPRTARVIRSVTVEIVSRDFVTYCRSIGLSDWSILFREVLPHLSGPLSVEFGLRFPWSVALVESLSYLGFGLDPPNWGYMISSNQSGLLQNPWAVLAPTILIALLTVGANLFGDAWAERLRGSSARGPQ